MRAALESLSPDQQEDHKITQLTDDQFRSALDNFAKKPVPEQEAIVRSLRAAPETAGSRRRFWEDLKVKAAKGGRHAQLDQAIRQASKRLYTGKEGKMP
jgi:hypothetical protein